MEKFILTSVPLDQLQTAITEAVKLEFKNINNVPVDDPIEYISRKEASKFLNISLVTLNEWSKTGLLRCYRIGSKVLYKKAEIVKSIKLVPQLKFRRGQ